mmetsp:Transcript_5678/g.7440  ORF Transcript_5678/g.7440 Transcript_5678/m.7440 type:complete len:229 (-) Transcript_5678:8-694(-)
MTQQFQQEHSVISCRPSPRKPKVSDKNVSRHAIAWDTMFHRLLHYKDLHGDCMVLRSHQDDKKLARWVNRQRKDRRRLSLHRKKLLDSIGFVWSRPQESWFLMFDQLVKYKRDFGNCLVPWKYPDNPKLGRWVDSQRRLCKDLSTERKKILERIGFVWKINETWEEMFLKLKNYKQSTGHCLVPQRYWNDPKLGNWVRLQRVRKERLSPDRIQKLNEIGFVWDARKHL